MLCLVTTSVKRPNNLRIAFISIVARHWASIQQFGRIALMGYQAAIMQPVPMRRPLKAAKVQR